VESESDRVSLLKETPTPDTHCFIWTWAMCNIVADCSVFDFCANLFYNYNSVCTHDCAPFIRMEF